MSPLEELLYRSLLQSKVFNRWVKRIHGRINGIRYQEPPEIRDFSSFVPTKAQKFKAFRIIWLDEMKKSIGLRR
ncbi:uncharacterized protein PRCAT00004906001 [Priceomyces carsonii]|uniref:uncharacterized protein n=1 Tax=Priceomyces carsonii TaxID=28549 RepID=UPI002ED7C932|nr:unnamed protein product [Priceomyces carsonii]